MKYLFVLIALMAGLTFVDADAPKETFIAKDLKIDLETNPIYILAYSAEVGAVGSDDIDNVLIAIDLRNGNWRLVKAVQTLDTHLKWSVEINIPDNVPAQRDYSKVPSLDDVEAFCKAYHWKFEAGRGRRLPVGEIYPEAWKKGLGFEPPPAYHFFDPTTEIGKPISADSIIKSMRYSSEATGYLLASIAVVSKADPRDYGDNALILVDRKDGSWQIAWVVRDSKRRRIWHFPPVYDGPINSNVYGHVPTEADVESFLKSSGWKFGPKAADTFTKEEVPEDTWIKILGFRPKFHVDKITR